MQYLHGKNAANHKPKMIDLQLFLQFCVGQMIYIYIM